MATITASVTGASQEAVVDGTTVKVFGGWGNGAICTSGDGANPCDSCIGQVSVACNKTSIYANLLLTVTINSTTANINGLPIKVAKSTDLADPITVASSTQSISGGQYSFQITWSNLCLALSLDATCNATTGGTYTPKTIYVGPVKDNKFVETVGIDLTISAYSSTSSSAVSNYTRCPDGVATSTTAGMACDYSVFPGDGKAYLEKFYHTWSTEAPATAIGVPIKAAILFAKPVATAATSALQIDADSAALATVTNAEDLFELPVQAGDNPLKDTKLPSLDNKQRYCFIMATEDVTGNIAYYTSSTDYTGTNKSNASKLCATPTDVIGVLSDKNCFIATAAFGSSFEKHVQKFREFRNKFLLPNEFGRAFVRTYYKYGPYLAHYIAKNEWARKLTRSLLWPLVIFVQITDEWGLGWALLFSFMITMLFIQIQIYLKNSLKGYK